MLKLCYKNKITESLINDEHRNIIEWLNMNKLSLNKDKSKYIIFHVPKKDMLTLTFKIDNINIEQVDEFNFIGLTQTLIKTGKNT